MSKDSPVLVGAVEPVPDEVTESRPNRFLRYGAGSAVSVADLIRSAEENPPEPILDGLLYVNDVLLIHGTEESYKSVFITQLGVSIASGVPLLRYWRARGQRRVGIINTEMHPSMLGKRLAGMFASTPAPDNLCFMSTETLKLWRRQDLKFKFETMYKWIAEHSIEVLMIDTANDFFRGEQNPNDEGSVGEFFDRLRELPVHARVLVRHDRKKKDIDAESHSNELIRGSAEWKEDPEAILYLGRSDKRTNEVRLDVGKLRYGSKPGPFELWFDATTFQLTPLPPVIAVLEQGRRTRQEIIAECSTRFGIEERSATEMISALRNVLREDRQGHNVTFELDPERCAATEWAGFLTSPDR
jgi:hypothetical protein